MHRSNKQNHKQNKIVYLNYFEQPKLTLDYNI